ncbi:hypothetical protein Ahy_B10g100917 isoform B [Arachis hypogaea]|uniref:P-type ATPase A domain-containing protein n=1 Tax=Arachis hypogaea TaxID=3818 RepID=A0A444WY52_ARAHY|nr:hypothetical protein Ahy_B10g100917 isoform B [Arachis hypogaea]
MAVDFSNFDTRTTHNCTTLCPLKPNHNTHVTLQCRSLQPPLSKFLTLLKLPPEAHHTFRRRIPSHRILFCVAPFPALSWPQSSGFVVSSISAPLSTSSHHPASFRLSLISSVISFVQWLLLLLVAYGHWSEQDAAILVPGDIINIKLGEIIPADACLLEGDPLSVDQSALTGESLLVTKNPTDEVFTRSTVKKGEIEAVVIATGVHTFLSKAAHLVDTLTKLDTSRKCLQQLVTSAFSQLLKTYDDY